MTDLDCTLVGLLEPPYPGQGSRCSLVISGLRQVVLHRVHIVGASADAIVSTIKAGPNVLFEEQAPASAFCIPRPVKHVQVCAGHLLYVELCTGTCECVVFEGKRQDD